MKPLLNLSLYLVVSRGERRLEEWLEMIRSSVEGGVTIVQLREKGKSDREILEIGRALKNALRPLQIPLIINDRVDIAHAIGADGVHLGQSDLTVAEARAILGSNAIIGLSIETIEQAKQAALMELDYIAASPVFPSRTKTDCASPWGIEGLKALCALSHHPVVAIGGMNETRAFQVIQCGAAGIALVSAICSAPCPKTAAIRITNQISYALSQEARGSLTLPQGAK